MSKFRNNPGLVASMLLGSMTSAEMKQAVVLDEKKVRWAMTIRQAHPTVDPAYLQTVSEEIVRRAHLIAMQHPGVDSLSVASFFLDRTLAWVIGGMAVPKIGPALPRNVKELGEMVLRERVNPISGGRLTAADLQPVIKGSRKKHVRTQ